MKVVDPRTDRCAREMISSCPDNTVIGLKVLILSGFSLSIYSGYLLVSTILESQFFSSYTNRRYIRFLAVCTFAFLYTGIAYSFPTWTDGAVSNNRLLPLFVTTPDFLYIMVTGTIIDLIKTINHESARFVSIMYKLFVSIYSLLVTYALSTLLGISYMIKNDPLFHVFLTRYILGSTRFCLFVFFIYTSAKAFVFTDGMDWIIPKRMNKVMHILMGFAAFLNLYQAISLLFLYLGSFHIGVAMNYSVYRPFYTNYVSFMNVIILVIPNLILLWMMKRIGDVQKGESSSSYEAESMTPREEDITKKNLL